MDQAAQTPAAAPEQPPRSFAEALAGMSDEALAALFDERPDLGRHIPEDFVALASRCANGSSIRVAWHRLNALDRQVLEVLIALQSPVSLPTLLQAMEPQADDATRGAVTDAVHRCRDRALLWGPDDDMHVINSVSALVEPYPCGLDRTDRSHIAAISAYLADPDSLQSALAQASPESRKALDLMVWGPPTGRLHHAQREVTEETAATPVEWLLARRLLVASGPDSVVVPREVALLLRGGRYVDRVALPPGPPVAESAAPVDDVDATGGMHALLFTRTVARLLTLVDEGAARALRSGGIYQRDAADLADRLGLSLPQTAHVAEVSRAAGLIAADETTGRWALTRAADNWRTAPEPHRWAALSLAWRDSPSHASWATEEQSEARVLSESLNAPGIAEIRSLVLHCAAESPPGAVLSPTALCEFLAWLRPQANGPGLPGFVRDILQEGEYSGVFGRGAITRAGRRLAPPGADISAIGDAAAWPALIDGVVLQADLTATAPGPLTEPVQARVEQVADLESAGAASIYRVSAASITRALDAGMATAELLAELADLSMTEVPAAMATLVHDVGRRHGSVRVLSAASVVACDDDAVLAAALSDRALAHLRLHRLAAGIASSPASPEAVGQALRAAGLAAVVAGAQRPAQRRRLPAPRPVTTARPDSDQLAAVVRALRAGASARNVRADPQRVAAVPPHDLVDMLTDAIRERRNVWLDYADPTGTRRVRQVEPLNLRAGMLSGFDHREQRVAAFPLSRIAGIGLVDQSPG